MFTMKTPLHSPIAAIRMTRALRSVRSGLSALLLLLVLGPAAAAPPSRDGGDARPGTPDGLSASEWSSIRAAYEAGRHAVHPQPEGGLAARNPGQAWRTRFDGRGFTVTPDAGGWTWGLELRRFGFTGAEQAVAGATAAVSHGQGRVNYDWAGGLREWFVNDTRGLEQGWTVTERPNFREVLDCGSPLPLSDADELSPPRAQASGDARAEQKRQRTGALQDADAPSAASPLNSQPSTLNFHLAVRGGLAPRVTGGGASVSFVDASGAAALNFGGLKAWDADGKALPARFEVAAGQPAALRVVVDERAARYPITVDPIAQQAYLKASNTGAFDQFGYSVAVSGDTVVVGASGEASSTTGVNSTPNESAGLSGAAYVFTRSGTIWTQQAYLKASNTGVGDQFGISVAVSGDTVVVGASGEDSSTTGVNSTPNESADSSGAPPGQGVLALFAPHRPRCPQAARRASRARQLRHPQDARGLSYSPSFGQFSG